MPGFTRQIILHTLTELMNEKPLSKITVKDIGTLWSKQEYILLPFQGYSGCSGSNGKGRAE